MKEFWKHLAWPDLIQSYNFVLKLLDVIFSICRCRFRYTVTNDRFSGHVRSGRILRTASTTAAKRFGILRRRICV